MSTKLQIALAIIGSGALSALISGLFNLLSQRKKKENGVQAGVRELLYDRIKHLGKSHIERGYITHEELEDLIAMHKIYHDSLSGNGFLDTVMNQVKGLRIHTSEGERHE